MADKKKKRSGKKKVNAETEPATGESESSEPDTGESASSTASLIPTSVPVSPTPDAVSAPGNLAKSFSFVLLLAIIGLIGLLSYRVMSSFVLPLFLAALLVVIFRPFHEWVYRRCGGRNSLAAGLTTATILLVALGPVAGMVGAGWHELFGNGGKLENYSWPSEIEKLSTVREQFGLEIPFPDELADIQAQLNSLALKEDRTAASSDVVSKKELVKSIREQLTDFKAILLAEAMQADSELLVNVDLGAIRAAEGESLELTKLKVLLGETKKPGSGELPEAIDANEEPQQEQKKIEAPEALRIRTVVEILDGIDVDQPGTEGTVAAPSPLSQLWTIVGQEHPGSKEIYQYEDAADLVSDRYALARQQLMGGVIWAPIIDFVNPSEERIGQLQGMAAEKLRSWMLKLTGQTTSIMGGLLMQLFIFTVATFYFLADGPQMILSAMKLSPMDDKHEAEIISEFAKLSRAVVVATLLSAIVQGLLAGVGFYAVGFDSLFLLIMLTTILAMIPFVGAAAVWVPACLYLAFIGEPLDGGEGHRIPEAIGLAIYGTCIVSMADNVIKPMVLKGQSNLHPLFALLSVLGGVGALGPIGVLVGPMVVAFLQSLLKILHKEMHGVDSGVLDQKVV